MIALFNIYHHCFHWILSHVSFLNQKFFLFSPPKFVAAHLVQNISFLISGIIVKELLCKVLLCKEQEKQNHLRYMVLPLSVRLIQIFQTTLVFWMFFSNSRRYIVVRCQMCERYIFCELQEGGLLHVQCRGCRVQERRNEYKALTLVLILVIGW